MQQAACKWNHLNIIYYTAPEICWRWLRLQLYSRGHGNLAHIKYTAHFILAFSSGLGRVICTVYSAKKLGQKTVNPHLIASGLTTEYGSSVKTTS